MAQALRLVSVRRGHDPRGVCLVPLGGAGAGPRRPPAGCARRARRWWCRRAPGCLSASGCCWPTSRTRQSRATRAGSIGSIRRRSAAIFAELDAYCAERMADEGVDRVEVTVQRYAELRYVRQSYELEVPLPPDGSVGTAGPAPRAIPRPATSRCTATHSPTRRSSLVRCGRSTCYQLPSAADRAAASGRAEPRPSPSRTRRVYFEEIGAYADADLPAARRWCAGPEIVGPAIVEQADTTTVVYPGQMARVDESGNRHPVPTAKRRRRMAVGARCRRSGCSPDRAPVGRSIRSRSK